MFSLNCKISRFLVVFFLLLTILAWEPVNAFSFGQRMVSFFERTTGTILNRASDIVYYLIMQKKYTFDGYEDPNQYINAEIPKEAEAIIKLAASTSNTVEEKISIANNSPIPVSQENIPALKPTNLPAVYTPPKVVIVPAPVQIPVVKDIPKPEVKTEIVVSTGMTAEILEYTNEERQSLALPNLILNNTLNKIAKEKVNDLFSKQYFEHISPSGEGASDIAKEFGYDFLIIGENLAMGSFSSGQEIVEAWMDSPGHRANILNTKYTEIGIAVKVADYKGMDTLMAVQIFAKPASSCSRPDGSKELIDNSSEAIKEMQKQAELMFTHLTEIKNSPNLDRAYYNQKITEYNYYAKKTNDAILALKNLIDIYNNEVASYNSCIKQ